jgi:hypothetical protein
VPFGKYWRKSPFVFSLVLQIPSDIREPGEEAASCARRELIEETGYDVRSLEHLVGFYPSPGVSNEFVDLFLGTELVRVGSPQPEGEQRVLEQVEVLLQEAVRKVLSGELLDGKTMIGILLCFHRLAAPGGPAAAGLRAAGCSRMATLSWPANRWWGRPPMQLQQGLLRHPVAAPSVRDRRSPAHPATRTPMHCPATARRSPAWVWYRSYGRSCRRRRRR